MKLSFKMLIKKLLKTNPLYITIDVHELCLFQESGNLLWEYSVGDPITASAYIDEHLQLKLESCLSIDR